MKAKTKLSLIDKIILCLNGLLCVALIISYFAPSVDPKKSMGIRFFWLSLSVFTDSQFNYHCLLAAAQKKVCAGSHGLHCLRMECFE